MRNLSAVFLGIQLTSGFAQPIAIVNPRAQEILDYWFGSIATPEDYPQNKARIWFNSNEELDNEIRHKFEDLVIAAATGKLNSWKNTPRERLALIILLDQFSRNIYRNTAQAYSFDSLAQELVLEGLTYGDDLRLLPIERIFFYLPLEHAENLPLQELSVSKFKELLADAPTSLLSECESYLDYAVRHYKMIEQFGRFPYRNTVIGRESSDEELEFLKKPNSSF